MEYTRADDREILKIELDSLTIYTSPSLSRELNAVAAAVGTPLVYVDLSSVRDIDSTGVGLLTRFQGECAKKGASVRIIGAGSRVRKVIDLLDMTPVFSFVDPEEACV